LCSEKLGRLLIETPSRLARDIRGIGFHTRRYVFW
jgi:hypothetical protein